MKKIILVATLFTSYQVLGCDCEDFTREYEESISELIFLGETVESNSDYYLIKIREIFKNNNEVTDSLLKVNINSCSIVPKLGEVWLIYASNEKGEWDISSCGYSENLNFFTQESSSKILPPRPLDYTPEETEIIDNLQNARRANQLYFEITNLRLKKLQKSLDSKDFSKNEEINASDDNFRDVNLYYLILIGLNLILIILLAFKLKRQGN